MQQPGGLSALVVDDGSPDGTREVVRGLENAYPGRIAMLERSGKQGLGLSLIHI